MEEAGLVRGKWYSILICAVSTLVGTTMLAHDMSTEQSYARMMKDCQSATMIGAVIFTTVPGMISDRTGSYIPAYLLLLGMVCSPR